MIQIDFTGREFPEIVFRVTGSVINHAEFTTGGILMSDRAGFATGPVVFEHISCIFKLTSVCSKIQVGYFTGKIECVIPVFNIASEVGSFHSLVIGYDISADLLPVAGDFSITMQDRDTTLFKICLIRADMNIAWCQIS